MGKVKPISQVEKDFVRNNYPAKSISEIARSLGRSRSCVYKIIKTEKLAEKHCESAGELIRGPWGKSVQDRRDFVNDSRPSDIQRLHELRDLLQEALKEAGPREMAAIAREYRATIEVIQRIEGEEGSDAEDGLSALAAAITQKMSS